MQSAQFRDQGRHVAWIFHVVVGSSQAPLCHRHKTRAVFAPSIRRRLRTFLGTPAVPSVRSRTLAPTAPLQLHHQVSASTLSSATAQDLESFERICSPSRSSHGR